MKGQIYFQINAAPKKETPKPACTAALRAFEFCLVNE
jgi:hypothetical protein